MEDLKNKTMDELKAIVMAVEKEDRTPKAK